MQNTKTSPAAKGLKESSSKNDKKQEIELGKLPSKKEVTAFDDQRELFQAVYAPNFTRPPTFDSMDSFDVA